VLDHGRLIVDSRLKMTYDIVSISLGFVVPVGVLVFCNYRLVCSLRQQYRQFSFSDKYIFSSPVLKAKS